MNDLKIFNNPEFGDIRTITINNEPYFVGKDVAEILGYSKARNAIATHVTRTTLVTGKGQEYFINKFLSAR